MFTFISQNIGSLLILVGLVAVLSLIVIMRIRGKRRGKSLCSGCSSCPMAGKCHQNTATEKGEHTA